MRPIFAYSVCLLLAFTTTAAACPYCDSTVGRQVRAAIFTGDLWLTAGVMLLPFAVLLAIVALVYFGPAALTLNFLKPRQGPVTCDPITDR